MPAVRTVHLWLNVAGGIVGHQFADGDTDGSRLLNLLGGCHDKAVKTSLGFKRVELHTVKNGVVKALPKSKELDGVAVAHPVLNGKARVVVIAIAGNVGQGNILVTEVIGVNAYIDTLHMQHVFLYFTHE